MRKGTGESFIPIGTSFRTPVPAGDSIRIIIENGDLYGVPDLYVLEISVIETLRGQKALREIESQIGKRVLIPKAMVYLLSRLQLYYAFHGKGSGLEPYEVKEDQFVISTERSEYRASSISFELKPGLIGLMLKPGDSQSGWLAFLIPKEEERVLLLFKHRNQGAVQRLRYIWFELY